MRRPTTSATWRACCAGARSSKRHNEVVRFTTTEDVTRALAGEGYRRPGPEHSRLPRRHPRAAAAARGRGRRRQDRGRSCAGRRRRRAGLIRLQCHEGIDLHHAVYDWDYQRQLLVIRAAEAGAAARELFGPEFLLRRPLLEALEHDGPAVLLIDEVDRADDEFEAFLLEFRADFAITIPELGTVQGKRRPLVVLTSNRTRELHDALKRRCLYHWIDYPSREREAEIRTPPAGAGRDAEAGAAVARLRSEELYKLPGVGETIIWARALLALDPDADLERTLGVALKVREDIERVRERGCSAVSETFTTRLSSLAAYMRAGGAAVGVGELLAAHRALAAVDLGVPARRTAARRALLLPRRLRPLRRGVRGDLRPRGAPGEPTRSAREHRARRAAADGRADGVRVAGARGPAGAGGLERGGCYARRTSPSTATPSGRCAGS